MITTLDWYDQLENLSLESRLLTRQVASFATGAC